MNKNIMDKDNRGHTVSRNGYQRRTVQEHSKHNVSNMKRAQAKRTARRRRRVSRKRRGARRGIQSTVLVVFVLAAFGIGGYWVYQHQNRSVTEDYVKEGVELLQEENYEKAAESFEKAIANEQEAGESALLTKEGAPYITEAYRGLGMACFSRQDYEKALTNLQQVLDLGGEATPVLYNLMGISAMYLTDYDGALNAFGAGAALPEEGTYTDTENAEQNVDYSAVIQEMKFNRIVCFEKKLDWANAKAEMEAYIAAYPDDPDAQKEAEFLSTK